MLHINYLLNITTRVQTAR